MARRDGLARGSKWLLPSGRVATVDVLKGYHVTLRYADDTDESVELLLSFLTQHGIEV
jgi:hypothetical protein